VLIREASFVVLDIETTGLSAMNHRITEIALLRVEGGAIVDRHDMLINPEQYISPFIAEYTHITNAMVFGRPNFIERAPELAQWIGASGPPIIVGHNVQFDKSFLVQSFIRANDPHPIASGFAALPTLCTCRLAKRLTNLQRRGLEHVANHFGIKIKQRHRAMGDAEATAQVLIQFLKMAEELGCEEVGDLVKLQFRKPEQVKRTSIQRTLQEKVHEFPQRPGVYIMRDTRKGVIYVGKAKDLRDRVGSYFSNAVIASGTKHQRMMKAVRTIEYEETGSELSALLRESRMIKEFKPQFNRLERSYKSWAFLKLDVQNLFPKLEAVREPALDGAEYYGPFRYRSSVEALIEVLNRSFTLRECNDSFSVKPGNKPCFYYDIGRCKAPCASLESPIEYGSEVERLRQFLAAGEEGILSLVEQMTQDAAEKLLFEEAQFLKERYLELKKVMGSGEREVSSINSNNCILLTKIDDGKAEVFFVRFGRLLKQSVLTLEQLPEIEVWFQKQLRYYYATGATAIPPECGKPEIDEMRILAMWIERAKRDESSTIIYVNEAHDVVLPTLVSAAYSVLGAGIALIPAPGPAEEFQPVVSHPIGITFTPEGLETARRLTTKPMYPKR